MNLQDIKKEIKLRFIGCFKEENGDPEFNARKQKFPSLTVQHCVQHCMPFQYAAIRDGLVSIVVYCIVLLSCYESTIT